MALAFSTALRNARADAITSQAGASCKLAIYDGTRPASGGAATTKLAEFTFSGNLAAAAANGVLTLDVPPINTSILSDYPSHRTSYFLYLRTWILFPQPTSPDL